MASLASRLRNRLGDRPAKLAFRVSNTGPVRRRLGKRYDAALAAYRATVPVLSPGDQRIVDGLDRAGVYVTSLAALGLEGSDAMLRAAQRAADDCTGAAHAQAVAGREFITVPSEAIVGSAEIFRWGLNARLLDIAEAYLGLPVAYDGVTIIYTVADGRAVATRQWHRDREDRKMIKVAVYCNDVAAGGGPFQVISRLDETQGDANGFRYEGGSEEELTALLGADYREAIVTCAGPAGTVIFVDTARYFHRGEPVFTEDRRAAFFSYFARATRHPFFCERSGLSRRQLARLAAQLTPRQRASTLWFRSVPAWLRLIPPAPV